MTLGQSLNLSILRQRKAASCLGHTVQWPKTKGSLHHLERCSCHSAQEEDRKYEPV